VFVDADASAAVRCAPRISSVAIASPSALSCSGINFGAIQRGSVDVVGSRLYLGGGSSTVVLELE